MKYANIWSIYFHLFMRNQLFHFISIVLVSELKCSFLILQSSGHKIKFVLQVLIVDIIQLPNYYNIFNIWDISYSIFANNILCENIKHFLSWEIIKSSIDFIHKIFSIFHTIEKNMSLNYCNVRSGLCNQIEERPE